MALENSGNLELEEDGSYFELNTRIPAISSIDNKKDESYFVYEQFIRGTTNSAGVSTGLPFLYGFNTDFSDDIMVGDVIALSSNTSLEAEVLSITSLNKLVLSNVSLNGADAGSDFLLQSGSSLLMEDSVPFQRIDLSTGLGDGSNNQTFLLKSTRNLDLEVTSNTMTLSDNYDGSNNFVRINEQIGRLPNSGLLLLEDGIGTSNAQYVGTVSLEGFFKFEENSIFKNQNLRVIK